MYSRPKRIPATINQICEAANALIKVVDPNETSKPGQAADARATFEALETKADKSELEAEVSRAQAADAALDGRVAGLEENADTVPPDAEAQAGKAADAKATFEALKTKASKTDLKAESDRAKEVERGLVERITELEDAEGGGVAELLVETTHADLVTLRDNGALIPGMQYRITDYVATTVQERTQSANHPFDIIVTADSANKLNEVARAIRHEVDEYFPDTTKFEAWQIWYSLDNDTDRFEWADEVDGKGVIYRMIDEFNNDTPYDFKGIKMQAYLGYDEEALEDMFSEDHRYTFGIDVDDTLQGNSRENVIKSFDLYGRLSIVHNTFGSGCTYNTFGSGCTYNTFGSHCYNNTFDSGCDTNTFGSGCNYNTFGSGCTYNTFGSDCYNNTFDSRCSSNTFDSGCTYNTFDSGCNYNTFGSGFSSNTFGSGCSSNTFGSYCHNNTFGSKCYDNTFGSDCYNNTFGSECYNNTLYAFFYGIILQNSVAENTIDCTADRGGYECCKNIEIKSGVIGKEINIDDVEQSYHTEIRPENSITITV